MISEIIHELIQDPDFPKNLKTDVSLISWFAREHDVSLEELKQGLEKYLSTYTQQDSWTKGTVGIWIKAINNILGWRTRLVGNTPNLMDSKLTDRHGNEYGALVYKEKDQYTPEGKYVVTIVQKRTDNEHGEMTGIPNAEYWDGTPGQYYASTMLGYDGYGNRYNDMVCIDGGSNWNIYGVRALRDEIERKFGEEVKQDEKTHMINMEKARLKIQHESVQYRAKKVYENLKGE